MAEQKKETLLAQAKRIHTQGRGAIPMSDEVVELVYAFLANEINMKQVADTLHKAGIIAKPIAQHAWPVIGNVAQYMVLGGLLTPAGWLTEK